MGFAEIHERFFPCQGGAFHIILSLAYSFGAINPFKNRAIINFAIIVKLTAALFLFSYYFFIESHWIILLSGMIDFFMGAAIWGLLKGIFAGSKALEEIAP